MGIRRPHASFRGFMWPVSLGHTTSCTVPLSVAILHPEVLCPFYSLLTRTLRSVYFQSYARHLFFSQRLSSQFS